MGFLRAMVDHRLVSLANQCTSLLRWISTRCCASRASDIWCWPGIQHIVLDLWWITWAAISRKSMSDASRWWWW